MLIKTLRAGIPRILDQYRDEEIVVDDCRALDDAAERKGLHDHLGTHPDNVLMTVGSKKWKEGLSSFPEQMRRLEECIQRDDDVRQAPILKFCRSGRHRSVLSADQHEAVLTSFRMDCEVIHLSEGK